MSSPHDIAMHFSESARQAAVSCDYVTAPDDPFGPQRNAAGQCPIGVMVEVDLPGALPPGYEAPPALLVQAIFDACAEGYVRDAAMDFLVLWDNGGITDLYETLGVKRMEARP